MEFWTHISLMRRNFITVIMYRITLNYGWSCIYTRSHLVAGINKVHCKKIKRTVLVLCASPPAIKIHRQRHRL